MTGFRFSFPSAAALLLATLLAGCQSGEEANEAFAVERSHHALGLADIRSLDVYARDGKLHLLVAGVEDKGADPVLRYMQSTDGGRSFSAPVAVGAAQPAPAGVRRGNDVQIAAHGQRFVALWQIAGTGFAGAGPMATAVSDDGGRSWRPGPNPAADDSRDGHAFADLLADAAGRFHLVWLDSRGAVETGEGGVRVAATADRQGLMYARSGDGGQSWSGHTRIDGATCECCWNTLSEGADGRLYVLYRDISPRDMALAVSPDAGGTWQRRGTVGEFGWYFDGCPHVGGGLAARNDGGTELAASVWTGKENRTGLYTLTSRDGGKHWSGPVPLGSAARHSDIALLADGSALAVWDAAAGGGTAVFLARRPAGTDSWSRPRRLSQKDISASHPRLAVLGENRAAVVWTVEHSGKGRRVAIAIIGDRPHM